MARLGGDELAGLLPGTEADGATRAANAIYSAVTRPVEVEGYMMSIDASLGLALHPDHGADADALLQAADAAVYVAKRAGGGYRLYRPSLDRPIANLREE